MSGAAFASPVEIVKVTQESSEKMKNAQPATPAPAAKAKGPVQPGPVQVDQGRKLDIFVRNTTQESQVATVRYWVIGRDLKTGKAAPMESAEKQVTLKPTAEEKIVTEEVKSEYKQRSVFGGKAPAEGTKITGYGVQIIREGKVLDEKFSEMSYKKLVGGSDTGVPAPLYSKDAPKDGEPAK